MKTRSTRLLIILLSVIILGVITVLFMMPVARQRSDCAAREKEWLSLLRKHPTFSAEITGHPVDVTFHYADPSEENLTRLREQYDLETIAGQGTELDRIINLMAWVYGLAGHANEPVIPKERNAFTMIHMAQGEQKQINCYMKTVILNEVYLSMGFFSRHTHLLPHSKEEEASHFITSVYSRTLGKWIMMDPDFGVYVTDQKGRILGIREIRRNLISGTPMKVMRPGRSPLAVTWRNVCNYIEGSDYFWFLSWSIFKFRCPPYSRFDQDSRPVREYFELIPDGYREALLNQTKMAPRGKRITFINNEAIFWSKPGNLSLKSKK